MRRTGTLRQTLRSGFRGPEISYRRPACALRRFGWAILMAGLPCLTTMAQDGSQKNTALVKVFPQLDQLVDRASALVREGRYAEALAIYAACEKFPDHVVPADEPPATATRYVGIQEYILNQIGRWPAEGRAAYRARFDPVVAQSFHAARENRDAGALAALAGRYPYSSYADDALALLGTLHLEAGRYARAAEVFERLLELPDSDVPRPVVVARLAAAVAGAGDGGALQAVADRAVRELPDARITLGDREVDLIEFLRRLRPAADAPAADPVSSWEMLQGSPSGVRVVEPVDPGARAWHASLPKTRFQEELPFFEGEFEPELESRFCPVVPAVSDAIVYLHTEYEALAFNLYASTEGPLWSFRLPVPPGSLMRDERLVHATTVAEGRVYVNLITALGQYERQEFRITVKYPFPKRALFCLDAYTGRLLWKLGGRAEAPGFGDGLTFSTPPTPYEGFLYVGAIRQQHSTDPFEHYVLCVDPASGRVVWSTFVASGGTEINLFGNSTRESLGSPVAVEGDSVYYCTNHGAAAALDRVTGRIRWLVKYEQLPVRPTRSLRIPRNPLQWVSCGPLVLRGTAFFAPTDSAYLYALDVRDGEVRWRRSRGHARSVAGSDGNFLILIGAGVEFIDPAKGDSRGRIMVDGGAIGRATVAADGIYVPAANGLFKVPLTPQEGNESKSYRWDGRGVRDDGNLVAAEGALVLTGSETVEVFCNRREMDRALQAELARRPDDPSVVYRAALRLLQSGRTERATELFARVVELSSGSTLPGRDRLERAARKRLFAVSMEAGHRALKGGDPESARAAFARARDAAPDAGSAVEAILSLATVARSQCDQAGAIREYQRLLRLYPDETPSGRRVFDVARAAIASILEAAGREPYRPLDEEAKALFDGAQADPSPEAMMAVYRVYPNSSAAERALLAAAEGYARLGRADETASTLRLFLRDFPKSARALEAQVALVRSLEKRSLYAAAASILRRMEREGPERELKVDENVTRVREFVQDRRSREEYRAVATPSASVRLRPPLSRVGAYVEREWTAETSILRVEGPPLVRGEGLVFLKLPHAIKAIDVGAGVERWRIPTTGRVPAAFSTEDAILLCTDFAVHRVDPATGSTRWRHERPSLMQTFRLAETKLCFRASDLESRSASALVALETADGSVAWTQTYEGLAQGDLLVFEDVIGVATHGRIHRFDAETGRPLPPILPREKRQALEVLGMIEGLLVLKTGEREIEAFDFVTGESKWSSSLHLGQIVSSAISPAGLFVVGNGPEGLVAVMHSLKNGKLSADPFQMREEWLAGPVAMDDRVVLVPLRRREAGSLVLALDPATADLSRRWTFDAGRNVVELIPRLAGEHAVVFTTAHAGGARLNFSATLLDRGGRVVQNIECQEASARPAECALAGGALIFRVENRLEVYR